MEIDAVTAPDEKSGSERTVASYVQEIRLYEKKAEKWQTRARKIIRRYKDERQVDTSSTRFNILWSNIQTLLPATYSKPPKPDIARRFKDADPVGRVAADVLERCTAYAINAKIHSAFRQSTLDYLLPGRGVMWARYEPHFKDAKAASPEIADDGVETTGSADTDDEPAEELTYEEAEGDYVHWMDFGHNVARVWEEVWGAWKRVYMDRAALKKRFPKLGASVPLTRGTKDDDNKIDESSGKAEIYEFWDSRDRTVKWFHRDMEEFLDQRPDPLGLEDFFPFPPPMFANLANDSLIPVPDYAQYQDQAVELDELSARITALTKAVKVAGIYDASAEGVGRLLMEGVENTLIPVDSWAAFGDKGFAGLLAFLPLKDIVEALIALYEAREKVKQSLYEITGLSDIIRGSSSKADVTATEQQIKSNFATMRLSDKQGEVQRFARDFVRIIAQIIAGHFSLDTIKQISGVRLFTQAEKKAIQAGAMKPPPGIEQDTFETMMTDPTWEEVGALLKNNCLRSFRIDIETDSTIKADQDAEKTARIEFLKGAGDFLQKAVEAGQQQPEMIPLLSQMLMFGVRAFPVGKELESAFATTLAKLEKQAANPQQKPDPEMAKVQSHAAISQQELQAKAQQSQAELAQEQHLAQMKMQFESQVDQHRNELESARDQQRLQAEMQLEQFKVESNARLQETLEHIKAAAQIEVARIAAAQSAGDAAEAREQASADAGEETKASIAQVNEKLAGLQGHVDGLVKGAQTAAQAQPQQQPANDSAEIARALKQLGESHAQIMDAITSEREIVRGPDGKATGVRTKPKVKA